MSLLHQARSEPNSEIQELRDKVEQAIVCINAALYVLLQRTETDKLDSQKTECGHGQN